MRFSLAVLLILVAHAVEAAEPRVEYGKPRELYAVEKVYLWTFEDEELAAEVRRQMSDALPALRFVDLESESDVTLSVQRKKGERDEMLTSARLARAQHSTIRLYADTSSRKADAPEAVAEVVAQIVNIFQQASAKRFGVPSARTARGNRVIHTTAGLRPGLSKADVRAALGPPHRVDGKGSRTAIWTYATTDGTMRLVFSGDRLSGVTLDTPKK
ncbi:MAG: hypothetical protein WA208_02950 [Thermoanaerobaculia bacterium]